MYLEVPVVLNYHIRVGHEIHIIPFAGLYYGLGLHGIYHDETPEGCLDEDVKLFGEMRELKRSDFGARLGIGISRHNIYLGAAYEGGFLNLKKINRSGVKGFEIEPGHCQ